MTTQPTIHALFDEDAETADAQCDLCGWTFNGPIMTVAERSREHIIGHQDALEKGASGESV